jgi:hypothetical protein
MTEQDCDSQNQVWSFEDGMYIGGVRFSLAMVI